VAAEQPAVVVVVVVVEVVFPVAGIPVAVAGPAQAVGVADITNRPRLAYLPHAPSRFR
jgi:hypothetical protein